VVCGVCCVLCVVCGVWCVCGMWGVYVCVCVSESLDNLEITYDPINESIIIFAERANSLGYLGRDGYNIDGIFYEVELNNGKA